MHHLTHVSDVLKELQIFKFSAKVIDSWKCWLAIRAEIFIKVYVTLVLNNSLIRFYVRVIENRPPSLNITRGL